MRTIKSSVQKCIQIICKIIAIKMIKTCKEKSHLINVLKKAKLLKSSSVIKTSTRVKY